MQLISILAAGVKGAESGTATISVRGTSTPAATFASFEGAGPDATGDPIDLDANGGAEVYVNQYVDVLVKSSQGATVREFTQGAATSAQEYIGQSFKGVGYDEGAALLTNQGVTTQAVFNKWLDSAGSPDWEVLLGGVDTKLTTAIGSLTGLVFNVKNAVYGADGGGTVDDTTAVAAAITACGNAGGGVVFFPQGEYRFTAALTPAAGVSFKGVGASRSKLVMDAAAASLLTPSATSGVRCFIEDLSLTSSQNNSSPLITVASNWEADVRRCEIGDAFNTASFITATSATSLDLSIQDCAFGALGAATVPVTAASATGRIYINNCSFSTPAAYTVTGMLVGPILNINKCTFDLALSAAGSTFAVFSLSAVTGTGRVTDCTFGDSGGGGAAVKGMSLGTMTTGTFFESDNTFPADDSNGFLPYDYAVGGANTPEISLKSRENRAQSFVGDQSAITIDPVQYGKTLITKTGTTALTITVLATHSTSWPNLPSGASYTVVIYADGVAVTVTLVASSTFPALGAVAMTSGNTTIYRVDHIAGTAIVAGTPGFVTQAENL